MSGLEGALPLVPHAIDLDCRAVGVPGEVFADIVHDKRTVHSRIERVDNSGFLYRIHFTPRDHGKHRVCVSGLSWLLAILNLLFHPNKYVMEPIHNYRL